MFLNLGLTADAAAAHTHEFSKQSNSQPNSSFLSRTSAAILPLGFMSSKHSSLSGAVQPEVTQPSIASSPLATPLLSSDEDYTPLETSDPGPDDRAQEAPNTTVKKQARTKTSFSFAHPPPSARRKRLGIRPRRLLQLHQVSQTTRPIPALDVLASAVCTVSRKFPVISRGKDGLSTNDLVLVTSDIYEQPSAEDDRSISSEDDTQDQREVVATVCHHRKEGFKANGNVEICLQQGSRWEASRLPSGGYEFTGTTESGEQMCVRWVLRGKGNRRISGSSTGDSTFDDGKRFTFSIIDPTTRRHPVIAWMSRQGIDVLDQYPLASSIAQGPSSPASKSPRTSTDQPRSIDSQEPPLVKTDDHLRTLIVISGVWAAFQEGWPQTPLYAETNPSSPTTAATSSSLASSTQQRSRSTYFPGNGKEKADTIDESPRSKSLPFSGGRISNLLSRSSLDGRFKNSSSTNHEALQEKGGQDGTTSKVSELNLADDRNSHHPDKHTRRSKNPGADEHHLHATSNFQSPRPSYGGESQREPLSNPPSVYMEKGKPERAKSKRWRRLSNWLGSMGKKKGAS
ncbi:hypothetical protein AJ79_05982 [Helicocarpus griseus UAMH5409]|uniref:Uncharacterized protein n=1 Tax=Helicocarpus griseus UAMH5409 TaxID=1447875 RepID=A0A2B7XI96_9EURO|nr:hypothetical protein AJ79_05982 [Helicocarpus griseus UAMH5409]